MWFGRTDRHCSTPLVARPFVALPFVALPFVRQTELYARSARFLLLVRALKLGNLSQLYRFYLANASSGTCHMCRNFGKCREYG
jgi:hypothetical protein